MNKTIIEVTTLLSLGCPKRDKTANNNNWTPKWRTSKTGMGLQRVPEEQTKWLMERLSC